MNERLNEGNWSPSSSYTLKKKISFGKILTPSQTNHFWITVSNSDYCLKSQVHLFSRRSKSLPFTVSYSHHTAVSTDLVSRAVVVQAGHFPGPACSSGEDWQPHSHPTQTAALPTFRENRARVKNKHSDIFSVKTLKGILGIIYLLSPTPWWFQGLFKAMQFPLLFFCHPIQPIWLRS